MRIVKARKHGQGRNGNQSKEYQAWSSMKTRCYNPKNKSYSRYGGRGIKICDEWLKSFDAFFMDMGKVPSPKHSLDRIDNDGNYTPENCRWATKSQQSRNNSYTVCITIDDVSKSVVEWCEIYNQNPLLVYTRITRGWSKERALKTAKKKSRHDIEIQHNKNKIN